MQQPITTMMIKILAYFLIPAYTILFTRGYNWFTTNFSVIGNLIDRKLAFFLWGVMVGVYYYMIYRAIRKQIRLKPLATRLLPAALLLLFCAVTTPYLPEQLPLKSFLHIIFAFVSTVLLLVFLALVSWSQYPSAPRAYRPFLLGLAVIVVVSAVLLAVAGIVSSALEIFLTVTTVILSSRLVDCLRKLGGPDANSTCIMK
ncbi:hypothetical protein [Enterocloster citroniae]|uniref:DUF998 domain-containing protein n=2 Tax=Enterocloster citroniae TaxID=358743 RepID=A0A0J9BX57_9FIRM|nr:hypothetical protein [Enterocloster citroniae]KMW16814.1 hypothetical protein HMPREF9470_04314 [[Clostridium] citroniae WAL-19142]